MICRRAIVDAIVDVGLLPATQGQIVIDGQSYPFDGGAGLEQLLQHLSVHGNFLITRQGTVWIIDYSGMRRPETITLGSTAEFSDVPCCSVCFERWIGLRGVCESADCRLYLNDLGIDQWLLEAIITQDYASTEELFLSQLRLAYEDVKAMIHSWTEPRIQSRSIVSDGRLGMLRSNAYHEPDGFLTQDVYYGIRLQLHECRDYRLTITRIGLLSDYTGKISVFAYTLPTQQMIHHTVIDSVAGLQSYQTVEWIITEKDVIIGWIPNARRFADTGIDRCRGCGHTMVSNSVFDASGFSGPIGNIKSTALTGGLTLDYSISCDYDSWLCRNAASLQLAIYYRTAMNLYRFAMTAARHQRVNTVVTINSGVMEDSLAWATDQFNKAMTDAMHNMTAYGNGCFKCREVAMSKLILP